MIRVLTLFGSLIFVAILLLSRSYPTIQYVNVHGAHHYDEEALARTANLYRNRPLLWVSHRDIQTIAQAPWIEKVRLTRHFPSGVSLMVWEKEPVAVYYPDNYNQTDETAIGYTLAGDVLPNIRSDETKGLTTIEGWGAQRIDEALELLRLLHAEHPLVINYTPQGFDVHFDYVTLHMEDVTLLQVHWQAFAAALQQSKRHVAESLENVAAPHSDIDETLLADIRQRIVIYPWGVSVGNDRQIGYLKQEGSGYDEVVRNHIFTTFRMKVSLRNTLLTLHKYGYMQNHKQSWASGTLADISLGVTS